jgi:hypothetical protein
MKNIKVYDKQNKLISDENKYENENDFINHIVSTNYFGKPERWIVENSEPYEESDVIDKELIINEDSEDTEVIVLLKADYTIEIIDLDKDYDWLLSECHRKRKADYPDSSDYLDAIVKGDEEQKKVYIDKCLEVKLKYPKPIRSNT